MKHDIEQAVSICQASCNSQRRFAQPILLQNHRSQNLVSKLKITSVGHFTTGFEKARSLDITQTIPLQSFFPNIAFPCVAKHFAGSTYVRFELISLVVLSHKNIDQIQPANA